MAAFLDPTASQLGLDGTGGKSEVGVLVLD